MAYELETRPADDPARVIEDTRINQSLTLHGITLAGEYANYVLTKVDEGFYSKLGVPFDYSFIGQEISGRTLAIPGEADRQYEYLVLGSLNQRAALRYQLANRRADKMQFGENGAEAEAALRNRPLHQWVADSPERNNPQTVGGLLALTTGKQIRLMRPAVLLRRDLAFIGDRGGNTWLWGVHIVPRLASVFPVVD